MAKVLKATIGIAFSERIFRISTQGGALADDLIALRGNGLALDSFESINRDSNNNFLHLFNKDSGVYLAINTDSITYTRDLYELDASFKFEDFLIQFQAIWKAFDARIKAPPIRRIGYVTEQRFHAGSNSNRLLVDKLTSIKPDGFPAKFNLTFEDRKDVGYGGLLNPMKDDFTNIIRSFYDSSIDIEHPEEDAINANLDVQRYFTPALKGSPIDAIKKVKVEHDKAAVKFDIEIGKIGIGDGKAAA